MRARFGTTAFIDEIQAFVVDGERPEVPGSDGNLKQAPGQAVPVDGGQGGLLLLVLVAVPGGFPVVVLVLAGGLVVLVQFVGGLEGKAIADLQGQRIDARAPVEARTHVAISPGCPWRGDELAVGKEVQPLAIAGEHRRSAFVTIAAEHGFLRAIAGEDDDLRAAFATVRASHGQEPAVRRPVHRGIDVITTERGAVDDTNLARVQIEDGQTRLLVVKGQ